MEKGKDERFGLPPTSLAEVGARAESAGVSNVYERKVYILNRIMNDEIGMGKFQWQLFALSGFGW